jgi:hypothetical protein
MGRLILKSLVPVPQLLDASGQQLLGPSKQLALVVFLAAQRSRRATREQVLAYLTGSDRADPRGSLRQLLYQIRHVSPTLIVGAEELSVDMQQLEYDVDVFRAHVAAGRLSEAAEIYTSDFLGSWMPRDAPEMQEWIERQRHSLLEEWRGVMRSLIARSLREGDPADALRWAELLAARSEEDAEAQALVTKLRAARAEHVATRVTPPPVQPIKRARRFLSRRTSIALGAAALLGFAAFRAHDAASLTAPDASVVLMGWGTAEQPGEMAAVNVSARGTLSFAQVDRVPAALRGKHRGMSRSRTIVARVCGSEASDSITVCVQPAWGALSRVGPLYDAQVLGWIADKALLLRVGNRTPNRYERRLVRAQAVDGKLDTLHSLGADVLDGWPDASGRFLLVSRRVGAGRSQVILHDLDRERSTSIAQCQLVGAAWSATAQYAVACLHESQLIVGRADSQTVRRIPLPDQVASAPLFSPNDSSVAIAVDGRESRLLSVSLDGHVQGDVTLSRPTPTLIGWHASADLSTPRLLVDDGFDSTALNAELWRPFGMPEPTLIARGGVHGAAFFNNGDDRYESGIALRRPLRLDRGLTIEWWAKIPITGPLWQSVHVNLSSAPADSFFVRSGSAVSDGANRVIVWAELPNPHGPAEKQMLVNVVGETRGATVPLPLALRDGRWHSYRLSLLPDGRAWLSADGEVIAGPALADLQRYRTATLVIQGRSVGTRVLVDQVRVWEGAVVPLGPSKR